MAPVRDTPRNYGVSLRHAQPLGAHLNCVGVTLLPIHFRRFGNSRSLSAAGRLQAHPSENSFSLREDDPRVIEAQIHFAKITADASGSTTAT